ncbi:lactosylceramide 4-alpha-galactosyltransferase-like [Salvia hispanica]|uniref:lactosylceramide 4-alpha-galactosyltransferase-like n=1 Tax=Salvia hispanica TaxID=49212 RepID=UPI0020091456|nr:lactosylceramide 4-alpha-galactosyltransferase-like [Salvia hispanica]
MIDSSRFSYMKFNLFSTITLASIILIIIFSDTIFSSAPIHQNSFENVPNLLQTHQAAAGVLKITEADSTPKILTWPNQMRIFSESDPTRRFHSRVTEFFRTNHCKVQAFMTWISPLGSYGKREFLGLETLFQTNPSICLIILSETMDSDHGLKILEPLLERGFHVRAMAPDLWDLIKDTPAEIWFNDIKKGIKNPGEIPLPQNLSNLIRLAVLYKYGGIYLDTDFIILKNLEGLRNSIGAQSVDLFGNWTRLNNAILVFDRNHPILYKFLEEFASTFDGNVWGHNGPYLVSRVVEKLAKTDELDHNVTILPPVAFYPVSWGKVAGFFARPSGRVGERWVRAKIRQLTRSTYGVHLWNSQSSGVEIEEGSIIERLISDHCVVCSKPTFWTS